MLTDLDYELLSAYIDDALDEPERGVLEARLQAEAELRSELDELRATVQLLNRLPPLKAPRNFTLDARYARKQSRLFTSATFSALSSAAAIILFALGAYLFSGKNAKAPSAIPVQSEQGAQAAFGSTETQQTDEALDKADVTVASPTVISEIGITNSDSSSAAADTGTTQMNDGLAQTQPEEAFTPANVGAAVPIPPSNNVAATGLADDNTPSSSAPAAAGQAAEAQRQTGTATEADLNLQNSAASNGGAANAASEPVQAQPTAAGTTLAFAAAQPPAQPETATALPTLTLALPTNAPLPTATIQPTQAPPTATPIPIPDRVSPSAEGVLPVIVIGLGIVFLLVAVGSTVIRRRNRL